MAPSCSLSPNERRGRMALGAAFVLAGFILRRDPFSGVTLVLTGSAITAAASLGH